MLWFRVCFGECVGEDAEYVLEGVSGNAQRIQCHVTGCFEVSSGVCFGRNPNRQLQSRLENVTSIKN